MSPTKRDVIEVLLALPVLSISFSAVSSALFDGCLYSKEFDKMILLSFRLSELFQ